MHRIFDATASRAFHAWSYQRYRSNSTSPKKLRAYPRIYSENRQRSRVKDLIDLVLIAQNCEFQAERLQNAITRTFASRERHTLPLTLPTSPADWRTSYRVLAIDTGLDPDIAHGRATAARLLDPIPGQGPGSVARWDPEPGAWQLS